MLTSQEARALARATVAMTAETGADEAEALVFAESSALTRFANNRINQNVAEENAQVNVRAVVGKRVGVATTNRLDVASLRATCEAAVAAARIAPADPDFPGLPGPHDVALPDRVAPATLAFDAEARATAVAAIIAPSRERGLTAAGKVRVGHHVTAVANSHGVNVGMALTGAQATVLAMGASDNAGSGWASFLDADASKLAAGALGLEAAELAVRSANPVALDAGDYTVVLAPEAVADFLDFLSYVGFSGRAFSEGRSFMTGHLGEKVMSDLITISDCAGAPHATGVTFDFEGQPKPPVSIIDRGIAVQPVTDSYWAAKLGRPNTGSALPAPNSFGPMPLNLEMAPGDRSLAQLIAGVKRGVYVTRFHYVNVEDPITVLLTGMTRDGTFMIENGLLTRPLKNLRFTQSAVDALAHCEGVTRERRFVGTEEGASYVPGLLLSKFAFTGQTA
ncbi:MAG: TldD/PmbA family protein [Coriobacteriia bacterium]|nr:TldD/PmbA family protein [Coriobacteriia bacterium]